MDFKASVDLPTWQRIQDAAAAALGLPVFCTDATGLPLLLSGNMPAYAVMLENKSALMRTTRQKEMQEPEPHTYTCRCGLQYAVAPVYVNGTLLCSVFIGPLKMTQEFDAATIQLAKLVGVDTNELLSALAAMPVVGNDALASAHALVKTLAKVLPEAAIYRKEASAQIHSLRTLLDFSNQLGTQLELEPLFSTTIQFCVRQFGLQDATIWYDDKVMRFSAEPDRNALCAEVERRLLPQVLAANSVVHIPDARRDFTFKDVRHVEALPNMIYALPLQIDGKAQGMLAFYAAVGTMFEPLRPLLQGVAARLSASLERAQSLRHAQESAVTDGLTGLYNKRYFVEALKMEVTRARQFTRATSLLIFDIDNFKSYNDTYGHPAGDVLLREVGAILRQHASQVAVACRYGGEEFVIILPEHSPEQAHLRAEQLRLAIAGHPFQHRQVTISVGVVIAMKSTSTPETMIKEADKALYHSKKTGKNKVSSVVIVDNNLQPVSYDAPMGV